MPSPSLDRLCSTGTLHVEPPAARRAAFETAYVQLEKRIAAFLKLPLETMSTAAAVDAARRIHVEADA